MDLTIAAEIVFSLVLLAGVFILFGLGWTLLVGGALGLIGAQFYGLDEVNE